MTPADPLAGLRDIRLPADPPPALAMLGLALLALLLLGSALALWRRHRRRAPWRRAWAELDAATQRATAAAQVRAASRLWRAYGALRYPAALPAGADETGWALFLAAHAAAPDPALLTLPYQPDPDAAAAAAYLAACRRWLAVHAP